MPLFVKHFTSELFNLANGSSFNNETGVLVSPVCRIWSVVPDLPAKALLFYQSVQWSIWLWYMQTSREVWPANTWKAVWIQALWYCGCQNSTRNQDVCKSWGGKRHYSVWYWRRKCVCQLVDILDNLPIG